MGVVSFLETMKKNNIYNIGDMFHIPFVDKIGVIISIRTHKIKKEVYMYLYQIYWLYRQTQYTKRSVITETVEVSENTINNWLRHGENMPNTSERNKYYPVKGNKK
jgi:hypothetical protein